MSVTLSNVPTVSNRNCSVVFYISNNATTGYYINALNLNPGANAVTPTILFPNNTPPAPIPNIIAVQSFSILYKGTNPAVSSNWVAVSQFTNFA
jgi:hypothetical protein